MQYVPLWWAFIQGVLNQPRKFPGQKYPPDGLQDLPCPQLLTGCHRLCQGLWPAEEKWICQGLQKKGWAVSVFTFLKVVCLREAWTRIFLAFLYGNVWQNYLGKFCHKIFQIKGGQFWSKSFPSVYFWCIFFVFFVKHARLFCKKGVGKRGNFL